jgi:aspartate/methionine/tyrosine aminotransferase
MDLVAPGPQPLPGLRPAAAALPESGIVEVLNYGRDRPGLIPLWVGEGDLPTPAFLCEAAAAALRAGHTFYTHQRGIPALRSALAGYHARLAGRPVEAERIYVTASGMQAVMLALQALVDPGDEVVMHAPIWPNIPAALQILGARPVQVATTMAEGGWRLDLDRLFDACGPRTRAIVVNSPNNPTGRVMPAEEIRAVRDFARRHGLWILSDEVYGRLVYDAPHAPSFLEACEPEDRLIVVNSFSKNWAMTGWRLGWLVAPAEFGQAFENLIQYNTSGAPTFQQHAGVTAVTQGEAFLAETLARCRDGRALVCEAMAGLPRVRFVPPAGAFYLFFAVDGEPDSRALAFRLVDRANVGLAPGTAFGAGGRGFMRLCFATSTEKLAEAMDRLAPALS